MYGKSIIGTPEAFEGYDSDSNDKLFKCSTADDFIDTINDIYNKNICYFNADIRTIFIEKYCTSNIEDKFVSLFE
jgi:hypothetical protein